MGMNKQVHAKALEFYNDDNNITAEDLAAKVKEAFDGSGKNTLSLRKPTAKKLLAFFKDGQTDFSYVLTGALAINRQTNVTRDSSLLVGAPARSHQAKVTNDPSLLTGGAARNHNAKVTGDLKTDSDTSSESEDDQDQEESTKKYAFVPPVFKLDDVPTLTTEIFPDEPLETTKATEKKPKQAKVTEKKPKQAKATEKPVQVTKEAPKKQVDPMDYYYGFGF